MNDNAIDGELESLITSLRQNNHSIRVNIIQELIHKDKKRAANLLFSVVSLVADTEIGRDAGIWLSGLSDETVVDPLIDILENNPNPIIRANAAYTLGFIRDKRAVEPLIKVLREDPEKDVRDDSVNSLGRLRDSRAVEPILSVFKISDADDRFNILHVLGMINDKRGFEPVLEVLPTLDEEYDEDVFFALVYAGQLGDERAYPILMERINDPNPHIRSAACEGLGLLGDERALEALEWVRKNDRAKDKYEDLVSDKAAEAIKRIKPPE